MAMKTNNQLESRIEQFKIKLQELTENFQLTLTEQDYSNIKAPLEALSQEINLTKSKSKRKNRKIQALEDAVRKLFRQIEYCSPFTKSGDLNITEKKNILSENSRTTQLELVSGQNQDRTESHNNKEIITTGVIEVSNKLNKPSQNKVTEETNIGTPTRHSSLETLFEFECDPKKSDTNVINLQESHFVQSQLNPPQENVDDYDSDCTEFELPMQTEDQPESDTDRDEPITKQILVTNEDTKLNIQGDLSRFPNDNEPNMILSQMNLPSNDSSMFQEKHVHEIGKRFDARVYEEDKEIKKGFNMQTDSENSVFQELSVCSQSLIQPYYNQHNPTSATLSMDMKKKDTETNSIIPQCYKEVQLSSPDESFEKTQDKLPKEISNLNINDEITRDPTIEFTSDAKDVKLQSPLLLKRAFLKSNESFEIKDTLKIMPNNSDKVGTNAPNSPFKIPPSPCILKKNTYQVEIRESNRTKIKNNLSPSSTSIQTKDKNTSEKKENSLFTIDHMKLNTPRYKTLNEFNTNMRKDPSGFSQIVVGANTNNTPLPNINDTLHTVATSDIAVPSSGVQNGTISDKNEVEMGRSEQENVGTNQDKQENYPSRSLVNVYQTLSHVSEIMKDRTKNPFIAKIKTINSESARTKTIAETHNSSQDKLSTTAYFCQENIVKQNFYSSKNTELDKQYTQTDSQMTVFLSDSQIEDINISVNSKEGNNVQHKLENIMDIRTIGKSICFAPEPDSTFTGEWTSDDLKLFH